MAILKRWAEAYERQQRSLACQAGSHDDCSHTVGAGGGFNPRRRRLEFGTEICKCPCHADCPVTSDRLTVDDQIWRASCTCPGAPALRARLEEIALRPPQPYEPYVPRHSR
jgi:hypothetical protein